MAGANPYVGPRSFVAGEALYGRDRESAELQDLLLAERIILLYSPSGSGKTSLLQAKLMPEMAAKGFDVRPIIRAGLTPSALAGNRFLRACLDAFPQLLDKPADAELLIFDQFEEVLTADAGDVAAKVEFFTQLGQALRHRNRWALFAMREDYIAGLDPYLKLVPTRFAATYRIDLLTRDKAIDAIRNPALAQGVDFTESAAAQLADNLRGDSPYVEPVQLQVVCFRLWEKPRASATQITGSDVGGAADIDTALAAYYSDCVARTASDAAPERAIRDWFDRRLISKQGTRTQVFRGPDLGLEVAAVAALIDRHLIRSDQRQNTTWYELSHDRLIAPIQESNRAWREANLSPLQRQAELWDEQKRPDGALLRGRAFANAERWAARNPQITPTESDFVAACRAERTRARWRAAAGFAMIVLAAAAIVFGFWGDSQARRADANAADASAQAAKATHSAADATRKGKLADDNRILANRNRDEATREARRARIAEAHAVDLARVANAGRLAATAVLNKESHPALALLLAVESFHIQSTYETRNALLMAVQANMSPSVAPLGKPIAKAPGQVECIRFSPDGTLIAMSGTVSPSQIWDASQLTLLWQLQGSGEMRADSVAFSPDGKTLATGGIDGRIWLWDTHTGAAKGDPMHGHTARVTSLAFSPDGNRLASGSQDQTARLWDVAGRRQLGDSLHPGSIVGVGPSVNVAFRRDSAVLASGDKYGLWLWDVRLHAPAPGALGSKFPGVMALAYSPTANVIAAADDATIRLWDIDAGALIGTPLDGHKGNVTGLAFSRDGLMLASSGFDDSTRLWDVATERPLGQPLSLGSQAASWAVAFSPDGGRLATGKVAGVQIWDVNPAAWAERACVLAKRNLSGAEWKQYVGNEMRYEKTCPNLPAGDGAPAK